MKERTRFAAGSTEEVELGRVVVPFDGSPRPYERLLEKIGDARFVLLGEATHGTHEFYRQRAIITEQLIAMKGFDAVAIEADWPDAHRVHRFVRRLSDDRTPEEALGSFTRFPRWMWRNRDVAALVGWLNENAPQVGFYGLDLYSMHASIEKVLAYLDAVDPEAGKRARARYSCFEHFGTDTSNYAYAAGLDLTASCEREVTQQLIEMRELAIHLHDGDRELAFQAEMNARLVKSAEEYYRTMLHGSVVSWNLRDRHMADMLAAIVQHLDHRLGRPCKVVVWEHNSHLGDARATQMGDEGELNVGQLVRERYGRDAFLLGFTTYDGTVTAAPEWGAHHQRIAIRPAIPGSHELLLHYFLQHHGIGSALFVAEDGDRLPDVLRKERLERAIGVVYRPHTERVSHWFRAQLADQFDALIHVDHTSAIEALDRREPRSYEDVPETFPTSL
jgi:erythromycin esterase-like protein